jgi:hypothetical protein
MISGEAFLSRMRVIIIPIMNVRLTQIQKCGCGKLFCIINVGMKGINAFARPWA